jgi:hypothetical protein
MNAIMNAQILFCTEFTETKRNPLTGDYLVFPKKGTQRLGHNPYACESLTVVSQMAQTMDHYEKTGEQKTFSVNLKYLKKAE